MENRDRNGYLPPAAGRVYASERAPAFAFPVETTREEPGRRLRGAHKMQTLGLSSNRNRWQASFVPRNSDQFRVPPFPSRALREMHAGGPSSRSPACFAIPSLKTIPTIIRAHSGRLRHAPSCATAPPKSGCGKNATIRLATVHKRKPDRCEEPVENVACPLDPFVSESAAAPWIAGIGRSIRRGSRRDFCGSSAL